jgi:hypothetical protein
MTFLRREEFEQTVLEGVLGFVKRHCKDKSIFNKKDEVEAKIDLFFGRNPKISRVASELGLVTKTQTANTELLVRTTLEFAYDNYKVDMEKQQKEISFLRRELRVAQQKSRLDVASATKRETETRAKERIILKKNTKLEKLNKENGGLRKQVAILKKENSKMLQDKEIRSTSGDKNRKKKEKKDKRFSEKIIATDVPVLKVDYRQEISEMYIYDIPKKYENTEVKAIIENNYGKVVSYEIKRLHKYQLIKAKIYLFRDWFEKVLGKCCYTTVTYKGKILNLRHILSHFEKKKVDEAWKRKGIIKIPDYIGEKDNFVNITEYLKKKNLCVPFIYGKNLIIQGELYFWAIFGSDERVKQAVELSKQEGVDNGWEILTNSKGILPKKTLGGKNLLSTIPRKNEEKEKNNKGKSTLEKSQLRKDYETKTTITKTTSEEEVVEIVDKFRKGVLDANAEEFTPGQNSEQKPIILEPNEVVEIIKEDCRSMNKEDKTKQGKNERSTSNILDGAKISNSSQQVLSKRIIDKYNETNARCEDNLRKVTEVKSERKRVISKDREDRLKFQAIDKNFNLTD